jgi:hypothetical protein
MVSLAWTPWTVKSEGIAFETQRDGIGDEVISRTVWAFGECAIHAREDVLG